MPTHQIPEIDND
jgi:dynein heavy chain, axonemal